MDDNDIDKLLHLVFRNLKDEYQIHLENNAIDFPQTEKLTANKISKHFQTKCNKKKFKIVSTNHKGPREELFYRLFGKSTNIEFEPYDKYRNDFMPSENDCRNESEDLILVNTALEKVIQYLSSYKYSKNGNELVISQITRMFLKGRRVEKAPKDLLINDFNKFFNNSQTDGIQVTTGISMIHCGRFLTNSNIESIVNIIKKKGEYSNKQDIKEALIKNELVDSNLRLIVEQNDLGDRLLSIENLDKHIINVIGSELQRVLSQDFFKVKLGYGKSYLFLKKTDTKLSIEECEIIKELLTAQPLRYLNLLELEYFENGELVMVKSLLSAEQIETFKRLRDAAKDSKAGYPDIASVDEWSNLAKIENSDLVKSLELEIKDVCSKLNPELFFKGDFKVESILEKYHQWNKHVGKTGGLRIQDRDLFLCVSKIEGDPFTIVGFPIEAVFKFFHEFGIEIDISSFYRGYWPNRYEFQKILNENQRNLINRKIIEQQTLQRIKEFSNLEDYGWELNSEVKIRESLTLIKLAFSINNLQEMKRQIACLKNLIRIGSFKDTLNSIDPMRNVLTALDNLIPDNFDMTDLSNSKKLEIARKIDDLGNIIYNSYEKISRYRALDEKVFARLENVKQFQLQEDPDCLRLENRHYSTLNIPAIENGIVKLDEFLSNADNNIKTFLLRGLKQPELKIKSVSKEQDNYRTKLSNNYYNAIKEVINSVFESIRNSFHIILEANEMNHVNIQSSSNYIADDWPHFKDYIVKEIYQDEKSKIIICLGNNGIETMMSLWIAYLLLHFGFNVSIVVKSNPSMGNDCTMMDLEFIIPYFEYLLKKTFGNNSGDFLGQLLSFELNCNNFEIIEANNKVELEEKLKGPIEKIRELKEKKVKELEKKKAKESKEEKKKELEKEIKKLNEEIKIFTLFIGEVWYTEIVGTDELEIPPYTLFKDKKGIMSTAYSLHVHKNRKKPLAVMNQDIFTKKGMFITPELTTGWYLSQIFRPIVKDGLGWMKKEQSYKLEIAGTYKTIDLVSLINEKQQQQDFEEQLLKDCSAYAGLPEKDSSIYRDEIKKGNKLRFTYKSPHKFVIVIIDKSRIDITVLMEYDYSRIFRTGGTEWRTIQDKIPRLIAAIFTGLLDRHYKVESTPVGLFTFDKIELIPVGDNKEVVKLKPNNIYLNDSRSCRKVKSFLRNEFYEITIQPTISIKTRLKKFDALKGEPLFAKVCIYNKVSASTKGSCKYDKRTRIYPARYLDEKIKIRIQELWNNTVYVSIDAIALFIETNVPRKIQIINFQKKPFVIKKENVINFSFSKSRLTVNNIKNAGAIAGPVDTLTTCDKRVDFAKVLNKKPISFTELIRIGSIFLDTDIIQRNYWSDPNYTSGLPRMELSSEEGPVIFQLAGPHNLPFKAPDWIFKKSETGELDDDSVVRIFSASAQLAVLAGAAAIDINMCCSPMHSQGGGTKLLEKESHNLAYMIVKKVRESIGSSIPLSCKTRLLQKEDTGSFVVDEDASKEFYINLFKNGADWITVETRIVNDGQGLINDHFARSKRSSLKRIIEEMKLEEPELMKEKFFFLNGEVIHFIDTLNINDFKAIKDTGCVGAVVSMGNRVDKTIIDRCKGYLQSNNPDKIFQDQPIEEPKDVWDSIKSDNKKFIKYVADIIRGYDCANCDYRGSCEEGTRCYPIAAKLWMSYETGLPDSIRANYIMKRLAYIRRDKFKKLWDLILNEKQLWPIIKK